jgi:hypothetical protein
MLAFYTRFCAHLELKSPNYWDKNSGNKVVKEVQNTFPAKYTSTRKFESFQDN